MWGEVRHKKPRQRRVFVLLGELRCRPPEGYAHGGSPPAGMRRKLCGDFVGAALSARCESL